MRRTVLLLLLPGVVAAKSPNDAPPQIAYAAPDGAGCAWFEAPVAGGAATRVAGWDGPCATFGASTTPDGSATLVVSGTDRRIVLVRRTGTATVLPQPAPGSSEVIAVSWDADGVPWAYTADPIVDAGPDAVPTERVRSWSWSADAWTAAETADVSYAYDTLDWETLPAWKRHVGWHSTDNLDPRTLPAAGAAKPSVVRALERDLPDVLDSASTSSWWTFATEAGPVALPVSTMTNTAAREPLATRVGGTWTELELDEDSYAYEGASAEVRGPLLLVRDIRGARVLDLRTRRIVWSSEVAERVHFVP